MRAVDPRRVVVTGLGALTPVGNTAEEFWAALTQGRSGIGPDHQVRRHRRIRTRIAGEIRNFDPLKYIDKKEARRLDPYLQYAIATQRHGGGGRRARSRPRSTRTRFGVLIGSGIGGITTLLEGRGRCARRRASTACRPS